MMDGEDDMIDDEEEDYIVNYALTDEGIEKVSGDNDIDDEGSDNGIWAIVDGNRIEGNEWGEEESTGCSVGDDSKKSDLLIEAYSSVTVDEAYDEEIECMKNLSECQVEDEWRRNNNGETYNHGKNCTCDECVDIKCIDESRRVEYRGSYGDILKAMPEIMRRTDLYSVEERERSLFRVRIDQIRRQVERAIEKRDDESEDIAERVGVKDIEREMDNEEEEAEPDLVSESDSDSDEESEWNSDEELLHVCNVCKQYDKLCVHMCWICGGSNEECKCEIKCDICKNYNGDCTCENQVTVERKRKFRDTSVQEMVNDDNSTSVIVNDSKGKKILMRVRNEHIICEGEVVTGTVLNSSDRKVSMEVKNLLIWRHTDRELERIKKSTY